MPYDPVTGRRAEIVISPETTVNRMNFGRIYEQSLKAALVELRDFLVTTTGLNEHSPNLKLAVAGLNKDILDTCFRRIERFLEITVKTQYEFYTKLSFHH